MDRVFHGLYVFLLVLCVGVRVRFLAGDDLAADPDGITGVADAARVVAGGLFDGGCLPHAFALAEGIALVFDGVNVGPCDGLFLRTGRQVGLVGVDRRGHDAGTEGGSDEEEGVVHVFHGSGTKRWAGERAGEFRIPCSSIVNLTGLMCARAQVAESLECCRWL